MVVLSTNTFSIALCLFSNVTKKQVSGIILPSYNDSNIGFSLQNGVIISL
jgi:hypothetical protein